MIGSAALVAALLLMQTPRDVAPAASGTASLGGVVTTADAVGGRSPLRRALVTLTGAELGVPRKTTKDEFGKFLFPGLPGGRYTITIDKPGFLRTYVGSRRVGFPPALPIALADGQHLDALPMSVVRGAAIEGRVLDPNGAPVPSAQVSVWETRYAYGQRTLERPAGGAPPWVVTDDRGAYRLYGLRPGEYVVLAAPSMPLSMYPRFTDADQRAVEADVRGRAGFPQPPVAPPAGAEQLASTYFPSTLDPILAQAFTVEAGETHPATDVVLQVTRKYRASVRVSGPLGPPPADALIGLADLRSLRLFASPGFLRPDAQGHGALGSVANGRYLFFGKASQTAPDGRTTPLYLSAEMLVDNGDVVDAPLPFVPGSVVRGAMTAVSGTLVPRSSTGAPARVTLQPLPYAPGATFSAAFETSTDVNPDGTFAFDGVAPGRYRVTVTGMPGMTLTTAAYQNIDTLDDALTVHIGENIDGLSLWMTDQHASVAGTVTDAAGKAVPEFTAVLFAKDPRYWPIAPRRVIGPMRLGSDGHFRADDVVPGEYWLAVVVDATPEQLRDPTFLEQLVPGAVAVVVGAGQQVIQHLRVG